MRLRMRLGPGEVSHRYAVTFRFPGRPISPVGTDRARVMRGRRSLVLAAGCYCCCHRHRVQLWVGVITHLPEFLAKILDHCVDSRARTCCVGPRSPIQFPHALAPAVVNPD